MANGKQLSQKGAEEILDIIDSYIDVKEAVEPDKKKTFNNYHCTEEDYIKAFKDGAEFGYNKANEWHKQSDEDDIYDACNDWNVHSFLCKMKDGSYNIAIGNCDEDYNGGVSTNIFFEIKDERYYIDDVEFWKEIVPPKESEAE